MSHTKTVTIYTRTLGIGYGYYGPGTNNSPPTEPEFVGTPRQVEAHDDARTSSAQLGRNFFLGGRLIEAIWAVSLDPERGEFVWRWTSLAETDLTNPLAPDQIGNGLKVRLAD